MNIETGLTEMPDFHRSDRNLEEMSEYCPTVRQFWDHVGKFTARINPEHLVSVDLATMCHPLVPAVARMGVWVTGLGEILRDEHYSHKDRTGFLGRQLKMEIRSDRNNWSSADFSKR